MAACVPSPGSERLVAVAAPVFETKKTFDPPLYVNTSKRSAVCPELKPFTVTGTPPVVAAAKVQLVEHPPPALAMTKASVAILVVLSLVACVVAVVPLGSAGVPLRLAAVPLVL
jgi:hypothetical protein